MMINSYNDLVYAVAKRVKELGDKKIDELRIEAGYGCDTWQESVRMNRYKGRGELMEEILTEEFVLEFDKDFEDS